MRKGIRTFEQRIREHESYLETPWLHVESWDSLTETHKEALKRHWRKEIRNFQESIESRKEELGKRGEWE